MVAKIERGVFLEPWQGYYQERAHPLKKKRKKLMHSGKTEHVEKKRNSPPKRKTKFVPFSRGRSRGQDRNRDPGDKSEGRKCVNETDVGKGSFYA